MPSIRSLTASTYLHMERRTGRPLDSRAKAIRAWTPGQPPPFAIDVLQLQGTTISKTQQLHVSGSSSRRSATTYLLLHL